MKRVSQRSAECRGFSPGAPVSSHKESGQGGLGKTRLRKQYHNRQFQLSTNFLSRQEIYHYSSKEHPKISKTAKFGCEML